MSNNSDFQEILLMQDQPQIIKNPSEQSNSYEKLSPSQQNQSITYHTEQNSQNQNLLQTSQIVQEYSKKQNLKQNQNNFNESLISENKMQQKIVDEKVHTDLDCESGQFKDSISQKLFPKIKDEIKQSIVQTKEISGLKQKHSTKKGDPLMACQRENKHLFIAKQPKKQKKVVKKVVQPLIQQQQQVLDKEFITRATHKFEEFFSKCKSYSGQFTCLAEHTAKNVCCSKQCNQAAYICDVENCSFKNKHQSCILKLDIQMYIDQLNKNLQRQRDISLQWFLFEQQIIQKIEDNRNKVKKLLPFQGMSCDEFIQCLNTKEKTNLALKGSHILTIFDQCHKEKSNDLYRLQSLRKLLAEERKTAKNLLQSPVRMVLKRFNTEELIRMPSKLVMDQPEIKFVLEQLNYPRDLKLLFRASQHEFDLSKYHKICDNTENTLTIIKTQHQKLIGCFTPLKLSNKIGRDKTNKSFLLAINLQERLQHIHSGQCAIYYNKQLGPCFGGLYEQRDIEVYQQKGVLFCKTNFPNAYNWKRHFFSSQESWRFLTGVTQGKVCRVMDFQVFKVQFRA